MNRFGLDTQIAGKDVMVYMAELLEKNENKEIEIERGKLAIATLKQMNNRCRLLLDASKLELKKVQLEQESKS